MGILKYQERDNYHGGLMTDRSDKTIFKDSAQEMAVDIDAEMDKVLNADAKASDMSMEAAADSGESCSFSCECCRHKVRSEKEYKDLISRLNRIEGQIRGIRGMVDNSAYCLDILTQVSAATSALNSFSKVLLSNHVKSCVANDIREGHEDKLDELISFLPKMMR